jgi:hypothetical protein
VGSLREPVVTARCQWHQGGARRPAGREAAAFVLALVAWAGCGGGGPAVEKVTGVVTLDGKPVEGATVSFVPAAGGLFASGLTAPDGTFTLNTAAPGAKPGSGAVAGDYRVAIVKMESSGQGRTADPNDPSYDPLASVSENPNAPKKPKYLVPQAYGDAATSGLQATVTKGTNTPTFALDSKFKP